MGWDAEDWSAVAVAVSGGVTAVMAAYTRLAAKRTSDMASGTHDLAEQTKALALATRDMSEQTKISAEAEVEEARATRELVEEARRDRELAWSPYLVVRNSTEEVERIGPGSPFLRATVTVTNVGRGPALNCFYYKWMSISPAQQVWCFARLGAIAGDGGEQSDQCFPGNDSPRPHLAQLTSADDASSAAVSAVILCEDIVGNKLRFLVGPWKRNIAHPNDPDPQPGWANDLFVWT